MVIRHDSEFGPAVDDGKQTEVIVGRRLLARTIRQGEAIEHLVLQQQLLTLGPRLENGLARRLDALFELFATALDHELVEFGHRFGILADLLLRRRVENGQARIHVPFVGVDAQGDVDLDVLDASNPAGEFPGELIVCLPSRTHAQKGGVCNRLRVGGDPVMHLSR